MFHHQIFIKCSFCTWHLRVQEHIIARWIIRDTEKYTAVRGQCQMGGTSESKEERAFDGGV